jgi:hypothetical protein
MDSATGSASEGQSSASVELTKLLWEEYRYRHDLIWRLLFRVTAVATALSIAPFGIEDLVKSELGFWVTFLPVLGVLTILGSGLIFDRENRRFNEIKAPYRNALNQAAGQEVHPLRKPDLFERFLFPYLGCLLILELVIVALVWFKWYPSIA